MDLIDHFECIIRDSVLYFLSILNEALRVSVILG